MIMLDYQNASSCTLPQIEVAGEKCRLMSDLCKNLTWLRYGEICIGLIVMRKDAEQARLSPPCDNANFGFDL